MLDNKKLNILILGSSGFIGENLLNFLRKNNPNSRISTFSFEENGDYKDEKVLRQFLNNQDIIYHCISETHPASSWNTPEEELTRNLAPFIQFLKLSKEANVKKIVFCSSGGTVYGVQEGILNENCYTRPFSPHGITKLSMENFLEYMRIKENLQYDIYRISNPYGPNQNTYKKGLGVISTWIHQILNGEEITIFGDGEIIRDYIYIDDTVSLLSQSLKLDFSQSHLFNLSYGEGTSLNHLLHVFEKVLNRKVKVKYIDSRKNDNPKVILDNQKLLQHIPRDFKFTSLEDGIKKCFQSFPEFQKRN